MLSSLPIMPPKLFVGHTYITHIYYALIMALHVHVPGMYKQVSNWLTNKERDHQDVNCQLRGADLPTRFIIMWCDTQESETASEAGDSEYLKRTRACCRAPAAGRLSLYQPYSIIPYDTHLEVYPTLDIRATVTVQTFANGQWTSWKRKRAWEGTTVINRLVMYQSHNHLNITVHLCSTNLTLISYHRVLD
jgi:hypothetical protein